MSRRQKSGGQALVLVTLALIAMAGMMGLAVDLGWSFFVEKQAQAAADGAALAAVQEAVVRIRGAGGSVSGFSCGSAGTVDCETTAVSCASVAASSNLNNGCQYALKNGFDWTSARQGVTMQSNSYPTLPSGAPNVNNISYWVTVRTVQTIPQLFSAVLGNTQSVVSAVATAAIAGGIQPGSFYGMNRRADCQTDSTGANVNCGLDILGGSGQGQMNCPGSPGNGKADICAPSGIILASNCSSVSTGSCDQAYAGGTQGNNQAYGSSLTIMGNGSGGGGAVQGNWSPSTPTWSQSAKTFADPTSQLAGGAGSQPPIPSSALPSCGIQGGAIIGGNKGVTLGGYQYYAYTSKDLSGRPIPSGAPVTISGTVTFDASTGVCPSGGYVTAGASQNTQFPTYVFWGGLNQADGTATLGAGQYVFAGVNSGANGAAVFTAQGTMTGNTSTGTMFIFTDGAYPNLPTQMGNLPNSGSMPALYQGTLSFKNPTITLSGLVSDKVSGSNLPSSMDGYAGVAWWQDRRNSTVGYNQAAGTTNCPDCTGDDGSVLYCRTGGDCTVPDTSKLNALKLTNHVTNTSPGVTLDPGNGNIAVNGVFYQPRGAWTDLVHGTTGFSCPGQANSACPLQIVTGLLTEQNGDTGMLLEGPTNPLQTFKATLIQ